MRYQDFELEISKNDSVGNYTAKVRSPLGEAQENFALPDAVSLENLILKMRGFSRSSRSPNSPEMQAACRFGEMLFDNAFKGDVGNLFKSCLDSTTTDSGLRIKLILQNAAELSALPWEFLYHPKKRDFLAHSPATPIVRYLQHATAIKPLEVTLPLKLLVVIASPSDIARLDTAKERRELEQALKPLEEDGELQITWIEKATIASLAEALEEQSFHLLHFIGHSYFDEKQGEGALILEDAQGRSDYYEAARLKVLLHDHHSLRLVVLNSCEGAKQDERDPFSSIATTLMLAGIPAVIAMQFEISDQAAITFAKIFYKWLAKAIAIDEAVGKARKYLYAVEKNNVEWGTPVLYLRAKDGVLFTATQVSNKAYYVPQTDAFEKARLALEEEQKKWEEEKALINQKEELKRLEEQRKHIESERQVMEEKMRKSDTDEFAKQEQREREGKEYCAKANELYGKKDYTEAVKCYQISAEWGNAEGQCWLGFMYHNGYGVKQDYAEAVKWYRKSAEQGNAPGQSNLGIMYRFGYGVKQDYVEAVKWYQKSAEQGNALGQRNLGIMYQNGYGVKQDYTEALKWYQKSAEQGNATGQNDVGVMYQYGYGIKQDYAEAVKWYQKSAEQGSAYGQYCLGLMYENGNGVVQDKHKALELYRKAAAQNENEQHKKNFERLQKELPAPGFWEKLFK